MFLMDDWNVCFFQIYYHKCLHHFVIYYVVVPKNWGSSVKTIMCRLRYLLSEGLSLNENLIMKNTNWISMFDSCLPVMSNTSEQCIVYRKIQVLFMLLICIWAWALLSINYFWSNNGEAISKLLFHSWIIHEFLHKKSFFWIL